MEDVLRNSAGGRKIFDAIRTYMSHRSGGYLNGTNLTGADAGLPALW
jgi:hypothetical protein